jgi:putative SOS response-associated peptidase YedK
MVGAGGGESVWGILAPRKGVSGVRGTKANPVEGERRLYGFLTTEANNVVAPIHPKLWR